MSSDHLYYIDKQQEFDYNLNNIDYVDIPIEENEGDSYLIDLYRDRKFLYNKSEADFKDQMQKDNAWIEISKIMLQKGMNQYTADYCMTRCTSLRSQYSREKRAIEAESKSGSGAPRRKPFPYFQQMKFLDAFIKRRSTYSNVKASKIQCISNLSANVSTSNLDTNKSAASPNITPVNKITQSTEESKAASSADISHSQSPIEAMDSDSPNSGNLSPIASKLKKRRGKMQQTNNMEDVFFNLSNQVSSYLGNKSTQKENTKPKTPEDAFGEFIALQLKQMTEPEKSIKQQKLVQLLTTPINELM